MYFFEKNLLIFNFSLLNLVLNIFSLELDSNKSMHKFFLQIAEILKLAVMRLEERDKLSQNRDTKAKRLC